VVPLTTLRARRHNHHLCSTLGAGEVTIRERFLTESAMAKLAAAAHSKVTAARASVKELLAELKNSPGSDYYAEFQRSWRLNGRSWLGLFLGSGCGSGCG
jgi:hypothetical protein